MRNQALVASVYGIDMGKTYFHVVGTDQAGKPIRRVKLTRSNIFEFFTNTLAATIGMEACPGSQWLARKLVALGHTVKIIPAQFVKQMLCPPPRRPGASHSASLACARLSSPS